jgi:hypothetical protein
MWATMLTFGLGILMMGLIVSNAGNAFRMRLALVPFVFCVAALSVGQARLVPAREAWGPLSIGNQPNDANG